MPSSSSSKPVIYGAQVSKTLLQANIIMAFIYLGWWFVPGNVGNPYLYYLLFFGEIYHVFMALSFWFTIWPQDSRDELPVAQNYAPSVDVFITVAGEPTSIVRQTVIAAKNMRYHNKTIYILNDGFVAGKDNWEEMEALAREQHIHCITRKKAGGAKAGNFNNAMRLTNGEIILIFDADMVPFPHFLARVIPYFNNEKIGFVQTPQYYKNYSLNEVTGGSWEQQEFFFGPIMRGKNKSNAAFICGTNVAIRRVAIEAVGGLEENNIAEDFVTSLALHQHKWRSEYVPEVLCTGLAPEDILSYYKQQHRWARGSLEVLFAFNPVFKKNLTWRQKIEYLSSALYYFNGVIIAIDIAMPILFLLFGLQPVAATTSSFALFFIPYIFLSLYTLYTVSKGFITFRAISFIQSSWTLQLSALKSVLFKEKVSFSVTPKQAQKGNFLFLVYPHIGYIVLSFVGMIVALNRQGIDPAVITNIAWALFNILLFIPFISAAYQWNSLVKPQPVSLRKT